VENKTCILDTTEKFFWQQEWSQVCYNYVSCKYKYKYQVAYNKCAK